MANYTLKVRTEFAAAHSIRGYVGDCGRLHGHNFKLEVEMATKQLDSIGLGCDFKILKQNIRAVIDKIDHQNLNEMPPFDSINPSAENIAAWAYHEIKDLLAAMNYNLTAVTLWENDYCSVRYTADD